MEQIQIIEVNKNTEQTRVTNINKEFSSKANLILKIVDAIYHLNDEDSLDLWEIANKSFKFLNKCSSHEEENYNRLGKIGTNTVMHNGVEIINIDDKCKVRLGNRILTESIGYGIKDKDNTSYLLLDISNAKELINKDPELLEKCINLIKDEDIISSEFVDQILGPLLDQMTDHTKFEDYVKNSSINHLRKSLIYSRLLQRTLEIFRELSLNH